MIGSIGAAVRRAYDALRNPPPVNQTYVGTDEIFALRQTLEFLDKQCGESHQGYYSTHSGWAGKTLKGLLDRVSPPPKRWYIRHKKTGLYLGSCHTTGDGIWTDKKHAESWRSKLLAIKDGLPYHPFQMVKASVVDIVEENEAV